MKLFSKVKMPAFKDDKAIKKNFKKKGLGLLLNFYMSEKNYIDPFVPKLTNLYYLYQSIILNKRITVLEFGSGWSTLVIILALNELKDKFSSDVKLLGRNSPFEIFVLENKKKYLSITKNRIKKFYKHLKIKNSIKINYHFSEVEMTTFNDRICTQYKKMPVCNPDFIYLDGPNHLSVNKDINGFSTRHKDMMPMISDILKSEYFYTPGTIIISDGRAANVKFLKDHFNRKWKYTFEPKYDQHIFFLNDPPLG